MLAKQLDDAAIGVERARYEDQRRHRLGILDVCLELLGRRRAALALLGQIELLLVIVLGPPGRQQPIGFMHHDHAPRRHHRKRAGVREQRSDQLIAAGAFVASLA
jgi:hypothetical protein